MSGHATDVLENRLLAERDYLVELDEQVVRAEDRLSELRSDSARVEREIDEIIDAIEALRS